MKRLLYVAVGCTPFLIGRALNWIMAGTAVPPLGLVGPGVLALWAFGAYWMCQASGDFWKVIFWQQFPAACVLVLLAVQELVFQAYWMNPVGLWTQMFYLPVLNLGYTLTGWSHTVFPAYCAGFLLLTGAAFLGCCLKKRRLR